MGKCLLWVSQHCVCVMVVVQVIKNPVQNHLPTGCLKIATSFHAELVDVGDLVPDSKPIVFVVGAMSHGSVSIRDSIARLLATY